MNADSPFPHPAGPRSAVGRRTEPPVPDDPGRAEWLALVTRQVAALRFGTVQIVVHEGRVTQVESTEKIRLPSD